MGNHSGFSIKNKFFVCQIFFTYRRAKRYSTSTAPQNYVKGRPLIAMKSPILFLIIFLFLGSNSSCEERMDQENKVCMNNDCFLQTINIGEKDAEIIGIGNVRFLGMNVYTAAFYAENTEDNYLLESDTKKALDIHYHRAIDRGSIIEAANKNIATRYPGINEEFLSKIDDFHSCMDDVRRGDNYRMEYIPGKGTSLYHNDQIKCTVEGYDFHKAYFGIWLSEKPLNKQLQKKLLGVD
jgi:hypothetical protein